MLERIELALSELKGEPTSFIPRIPAGRYANPREIANVVAYLVLDAPRYLTGSSLLVDGGLYA